MTLDEFLLLNVQLRQHDPALFRRPSDRAASAEELQRLEVTLGVRLPANFKAFLAHFGGGHFGLLDIFSAQADSEYYLISRNADLRTNVPENFIKISDDGCGGYYGFVAQNGETTEPIFYNDTDDGSVAKTKFNDIFEYVVSDAYNTPRR